MISLKRPGIRIFDPDGHRVSLEKLRRLADEEVIWTPTHLKSLI
jgi:hypothetical protein